MAVRNESATIGGLVLAGARDWPDATAIAFPEFAWTFADLEREALAVAKGLRAIGVRPGDHVGLVLPNGAHYVAALFGAAMTGATVVPLNTRYRRADLLYALEHSDVSVLLLSRTYREYFDFEGLVREIQAEHPLPRLREVVVLGTDEAGDLLAGAELLSVGAGISDAEMREVVAGIGNREIGLMLYTSGTTAFPKGCLLSHEAMVRCAAVWGQHSIGLGPGESIWIPNPLFHIGALSSMLASVAAGSTFHSLSYFDADAAVRTLSEVAVTAFFPVFDAIAMPILEHPDAAKLRFENVRFSFCTGNPRNVALVREAVPHAEHLNTYGMTETSGWCCLNFDSSEPLGPLPGGVPLPGVDLQVRTETGAAGIGELGVIHVRSWCTISGYYKDAVATAAALDAEGWFRTGDIGFLREDGSVRFQGRAGDMIKVGGENVAAVEVETFLAGHPAVRLVAVVGVPDSRLGTVPAAFLELYPGQSLTEDELHAYCAGAIARFKIPRHFRFVTADGWPMSTTKIRKTDLRDQMAHELGLAAAEHAGASPAMSVDATVADTYASAVLLTDLDLGGVRVALLTLNRPELHNPVDEPTIAALEQILRKLVDGGEHRAVIVTGAGSSFSSGGDLKGYQALFRDRPRFEAFVEAFGRVCLLLERSPLLTVAMVNGTCMAGGMEIALSCDLIMIAEGARIGDGHLKFSQMPGSGAQRLVRAIGVQRARHWLYSGDLHTAAEAVEAGLAMRAVPAADLHQATLDEVARLCRASPIALRLVKELVVAALTLPLDEGLALEEQTAVRYATGTNDSIEGITAFAERRPPHFTGT